MGAERADRRPVKIRRTGRHTTPSQVEKVAEKAGKAAPAVAIAGALVASPQLQHAVTQPVAVAAAQARTPAAAHQQSATATLDSITSRAAVADTAQAAGTARPAKASTAAKDARYTVRAGDTLSGIADRFYHDPNDWKRIFDANQSTVSNPNLIYAGEVLLIPGHAAAGHSGSAYTPRHTKTAPRTSSGGSGSTTETTGFGGRTGSGSAPVSAPASGPSTQHGSSHDPSVPSGTLGCSGLEELWDDAGGNPADAFIAAEIAMAESGGNQYALSPTDDYGYWQINAVHGALATFNAYGNARAAITISQDGTDWYPWTTYTSGAYVGRC